MEICNELIEFITSWDNCIDANEITANAIIDKDLGMRADDGIEFILAYAKRFNVDVSGFMAGKYFEAEGGLMLLFGKPKAIKDITITHLQKGINYKRLDEGVIGS